MKALNKIWILIIAGMLMACGSSGINVATHTTEVRLVEGNYKLVARSVTGEAEMEGILGASFGFGMGASQASIIPATKNRMLYKTAMEDLWTNFEAMHGRTEGRKLALTNLRYDSETLNTIVYTKLKVAVIADVIEFVEQ